MRPGTAPQLARALVISSSQVWNLLAIQSFASASFRKPEISSKLPSCQVARTVQDSLSPCAECRTCRDGSVLLISLQRGRRSRCARSGCLFLSPDHGLPRTFRYQRTNEPPVPLPRPPEDRQKTASCHCQPEPIIQQGLDCIVAIFALHRRRPRDPRHRRRDGRRGAPPHRRCRRREAGREARMHAGLFPAVYPWSGRSERLMRVTIPSQARATSCG